VSLCNEFGTIGFKWCDSRDVIVVSNCHTNDATEVNRKQKDGSKTKIQCPNAIAFYNKHMHGVDLADQFASMYDYNRKSTKWWKKVFDRLIMIATANSWIIFKSLQNKNIHF